MKFKLSINSDKEEFVHAQLHRESIFSDQLKRFVQNSDNIQSIIAFDKEGNLINLNFNEIALVTIIENRIYALTVNQEKLLLKERLYQVAEKLPNFFWKINKSSIINRFEIKKFTVNYGAGINVVLKNGISDYVSRRCFRKIRKELQK
ncbi:LytTR family DNA-binding domain-containing protein [Lactobacillus sp. PSON]|uniref:LytTR family DNA-binding domain-containing protein n=1 Tax=Lactobacillus sp. PSON TaxID=3455454 RepID=UPI00404249F0